MTENACRIDVWLWRARFFKTRTLAAGFVEEGRVRLSRGGSETRVDKPSRAIRVGEGIVFAQDGRVIAVRIERLGARRGPPAEARALYAPLGLSLGPSLGESLSRPAE
jgi:ribosomal 50S subunit-recycling heat shock protein